MRPELRAHLEAARTAGALGPGEVDAHVEHALGLARIIDARVERRPRSLGTFRVLDLGCGAGVPGLVLAEVWTDSELVLLDRSDKRVALARAGVARLGLEGRVAVVAAEARALAHDPRCRERFDLVVARGFGRPTAVAEAGAGFVRVGGWLAVSEPPAATDRWGGATQGTTTELGLGPVVLAAAPTDEGAASVHAALLAKVRPTPPDRPRRAH